MSADNPRSGSGDRLRDADDRLQHLEETAAFNDRAVEELTAQMLDLDQRLRRLMLRLDGLESRITPPSKADDENRVQEGEGDPPQAQR